MPKFLTENALEELNELSTNSIGILTKQDGFNSKHTSRILVIGLGGMGLKTMVRLKKELNERVGAIDSSILRILSIDTDKDDRTKAIQSGILSADEIPFLDNGGISGALAAVPEYRPKPISDIIPDGFRQALSGEGANQVRLAGRLTVMDLNLFNSIYNAIKNAISNLQDFSTSTLDVHVVAGIGGGSGSGLVVDTPYIVRAIVSALGIPGNKLRIFGHVYLPNAYSGIANIQAAYRNGYAALKEIEYYMNLKRVGETFDAHYPDPVGKFSSEENIFEQCTVIGGKIAGAIVMKDPQEKAISVCVEDLVNQCTSVSGSVNQSEGSITDFFTDGSFQTNADTALSTVMADPDTNFPPYANYNYNFIGATSIKFPTEAIIEQLVGEMSRRSDAMLRNNEQTVRQQDVDEFESGLVRPVDIIEGYARLLAGKIDNIHGDPDTKWSKGSILTNEHTVRLEAEVTRAVAAFSQDSDFVERAVAEANRRATAIFANPEKGPYYLEKILTSESKNGGNVQGYYEKLRGYNSAVVNAKNVFMKSLADFERQKTELANVMQGLGKFSKNLDTFKDLLKNIYLVRFKIEICDILINEHYIDINRGRGISYAIKSSLDRDFLACVDIFSHINRIMIMNADAAAKKLSDEAATDPASIFALNDPLFDSLKGTVMGTVGSKIRRMGENAPMQYAAAFTSAIINDRAAWEVTENCPRGQSRGAAAFRRFIRNFKPFEDIVNRSMMDYFEEAYMGRDENYKMMVVQKLIDVINYNAEPMCNVWDSPHFDFLKVQQLCYRYLVLPASFKSDSTGWGKRFEQIFGVDNMRKNIYWSPDQNAMYSYTLYARMPIWVHKDLVEYETEYYRLNIPGVHINENSNKKPALKEYPALMIPSQWYRSRSGNIEYSNSNETKLYEDVVKLFEYAKAHGIIYQQDSGNYMVTTIRDKIDPAQGKAAIDAFVTSYMNDPENSVNGKMLLEKQLFNKMKEKYGYIDNIITGGRGGYAVGDDKAAITLLRKQMKLLGILRDEVAYYNNNFVPPVAAAIAEVGKKENSREFTKYMLFGLAFAERGAWKYKLGDLSYNIVTMFDVQDDMNNAWKVDYMEIAATDAFRNVEKYEDHKVLLDERVRTIQRNIVNGDDNAYNALTERYNALKARCESFIGAVENRRLNGNVLTAQELEIKEFYTNILEAANGIMRLFNF